jgi:hypothetical protein
MLQQQQQEDNVPYTAFQTRLTSQQITQYMIQQQREEYSQTKDNDDQQQDDSHSQQNQSNFHNEFRSYDQRQTY